MPTNNVVPVSEYATALKKGWPTILGATIVGAILGLMIVQLQGGGYEAEARVEVRPLVTAGDAPNLDISRQVNTTNERLIASSQRVVERALLLMEANTVTEEAVLEADSQIVVTVPADSQVLVFTVTADQPERARDLANAAAQAYLDFRLESGLIGTEQARDQLLSREATLIAELDAFAAEVDGDDDPQARTLSYRESSKTQELEGIGAKLANLNAISIDPGVVLDNATLPESASGLPTPIGFVSGALLGLLAGIGAAYWLDRRDDRFRDTSTELGAMGVGIFGEVPVGGGLFRHGHDHAIAELNSESSESYRRVQGSLLFKLDQTDKSVVLVAGTNNPQSATTVAANLAAAAARSGRRTLLIGADLRRPSLHERFGLPNELGLSDVLSGRAHLAGTLQSVEGIENLKLLSSGSPVVDPARLLQGDGLGRLIASVRQEYDLIVFEAPPVMQVADAVDLARLCEGAVLVIEPTRATRRGVSQSIEQLRRVGADVVGTVVAENAPA